MTARHTDGGRGPPNAVRSPPPAPAMAPSAATAAPPRSDAAVVTTAATGMTAAHRRRRLQERGAVRFSQSPATVFGEATSGTAAGAPAAAAAALPPALVIHPAASRKRARFSDAEDSDGRSVGNDADAESAEEDADDDWDTRSARAHDDAVGGRRSTVSNTSLPRHRTPPASPSMSSVAWWSDGGISTPRRATRRGGMTPLLRMFEGHADGLSVLSLAGELEADIGDDIELESGLTSLFGDAHSFDPAQMSDADGRMSEDHISILSGRRSALALLHARHASRRSRSRRSIHGLSDGEETVSLYSVRSRPFTPLSVASDMDHHFGHPPLPPLHPQPLPIPRGPPLADAGPVAASAGPRKPHRTVTFAPTVPPEPGATSPMAGGLTPLVPVTAAATSSPAKQPCAALPARARVANRSSRQAPAVLACINRYTALVDVDQWHAVCGIICPDGLPCDQFRLTCPQHASRRLSSTMLELLQSRVGGPVLPPPVGDGGAAARIRSLATCPGYQAVARWRQQLLDQLRAAEQELVSIPQQVTASEGLSNWHGPAPPPIVDVAKYYRLCHRIPTFVPTLVEGRKSWAVSRAAATSGHAIPPLPPHLALATHRRPGVRSSPASALDAWLRYESSRRITTVVEHADIDVAVSDATAISDVTSSDNESDAVPDRSGAALHGDAAAAAVAAAAAAGVLAVAHWTDDEQRRFEALLHKYPAEKVQSHRWAKISRELGSRTPKQVASHAQKFFNKLRKAGLATAQP